MKKKKAHFNELDPVWVKLRHLHWMDAVGSYSCVAAFVVVLRWRWIVAVLMRVFVC